MLGYSTVQGMAGYGRVLTRLVSGDPVPVAAPQSADTDDEEKSEDEEQDGQRDEQPPRPPLVRPRLCRVRAATHLQNKKQCTYTVGATSLHLIKVWRA